MTRTETFVDMVGKSIATQEEKVQKAFASFKSYFTSLEEASINAKTYINTGETDDGNKTYTSLQKAETDFDQISGFLEFDTKPTKPTSENKKKSLKELDKLIEHVILNKINK